MQLNGDVVLLQGLMGASSVRGTRAYASIEPKVSPASKKKAVMVPTSRERKVIW